MQAGGTGPTGEKSAFKSADRKSGGKIQMSHARLDFGSVGERKVSFLKKGGVRRRGEKSKHGKFLPDRATMGRARPP